MTESQLKSVSYESRIEQSLPKDSINYYNADTRHTPKNNIIIKLISLNILQSNALFSLDLFVQHLRYVDHPAFLYKSAHIRELLLITQNTISRNQLDHRN